MRGSSKEGKVTRIFVKKYNGIFRIIGATVVNNPADVGPITMAVKNRVDIAKYIDDLQKIDFDLKQLVA